MATGSAGTRLRPVWLSGATPLDEINREIRLSGRARSPPGKMRGC